MVERTSEAEWEGTLRDGEGEMSFGSGAYQGAYTYASRFEQGEGANPEELIGAAHAGCFSMKLAGDLAEAGYDPERIHTTATVRLEGGEITTVTLDVEATVPDIDEETFLSIAEDSKANCPVSKALAALDIELRAQLT